MPELRSRTSTHGRNMAGARALWRATGMGDDDFGKPIIAIANSFTQFVPGHVHLKDMGELVAGAIREAGGVASTLEGDLPEHAGVSVTGVRPVSLVASNTAAVQQQVLEALAPQP